MGIVLLVGVGFEEQGGDAHTGRVMIGEGIEDVFHGVAGVHDILQHHHVPAFDAFVEADQVGDAAGAAGAEVAGHLHEGDLTLDIQSLHQFGGEEERTVEHPHEERPFASVLGAQLAGQPIHGRVHLGLGDEEFELQVVQLDACHAEAVRRRCADGRREGKRSPNGVARP